MSNFNNEEIEFLINGILETSPIELDSDALGYESKCPFCFKKIQGHDKNLSFFKHSNDCLYVKAQELFLNF